MISTQGNTCGSRDALRNKLQISSGGMTKSTSEMSGDARSTSLPGDESGANQLAYGVRDEVRAHVRTGHGDIRFGMVDKGTTKGHWFLGNAGLCEWTFSAGRAKMTRGSDPDHFDAGDVELGDVMKRLPVEAIFFGGTHPPRDSSFWMDKHMQAVIWITIRRPKGKLIVPKDWLTHGRRISHCSVGGVTDGKFWIHVATRKRGALTWNPESKFIKNVLNQIVDPTLSGRPCKRIKDSCLDKSNTALGVLAWNKRHENVAVPTVFSKEHWVKRRLSVKELCDVLDLPGHIVNNATKEMKKEMTALSIPGKILQFAFQGIKSQGTVSHISSLTGQKRKAIIPDKLEVKRPKLDIISKGKETKSGDGQNGCMEKDQRTSAEELKTLIVEHDSTVTDKAVKSDNAKIPEHLWNIKVLEGLPRWECKFRESTDFRKRCLKSFKTLRAWLLKLWKKRVRRSFLTWFHGTEHVSDKREDLWKYGQEAIRRAYLCDWWKWNGGSSIFFWRWPKPYLKDALYGAPVRTDADPPNYWVAQPPIETEKQRQLIQPKVDKVLQNGYVKLTKPENLRSLLFMFDVPKGNEDIRLVYDGTKSGLNDTLWAPWFALPTVESMCRTLEPEYWCADNDYGDQFLNFPLDESIRPYCGIDLSQLYPEKAATVENLLTAVWTRNAMGLKTSPYNSVQGALRAKRIMMEDHIGLGKGDVNPFEWKTIKKNFPGTPSYNPSHPWISKLDREGQLACDLHQYVDDLRITAKNIKVAWKASSRVAKICSFLGLQDAARKRREPSQEPGAWAGAVVTTTDGLVQKSVTQERWDKAKRKIQWLAHYAGCDMSDVDTMSDVLEDEKEMNAGATPKGCINHKLAEKYRGFLVYVSRTYTTMIPFLKGLHLTLDSWRENRDEDGWRSTNTLEPKLDQEENIQRPKRFVVMVPRFKDDMEALLHLTRHRVPPRIPTRPSKSLATYLVGDASGSGYGATLWGQGQDHFIATHGGWTEDLSKASSNEREAYNLILNVESAIKKGDLKRGTELFIFTDNMVSERCFHSGRSKSKGLHALIMKMHDLVMKGDIFAHFVWISGERMKEQGGDGLSRGDLNTGVLKGDNYLDHIPLGLNAFERHPPLLEWFKESLPGEDWIFLTEENWFAKAYQNPKGKYVWSPAPCVADVCLEHLCEVKHIHPDSSHVFVCPTIMTYNWRKQLNKLGDVLTNVKQGSPIWPNEMLEPVSISLIAPLLSTRPWSIHRTGFMAEWKSHMQEVYGSCAKIAGDNLCKFWTKAWNW